MSTMGFQTRIALCAGAVALGSLTDGHDHAAQTTGQASSGCYPAGGSLTALVNSYGFIVAGTDSISAVSRTTFNLPQVPARSVTAVSTTSVCQRAALAYGRNLSPPDTTTSRQMYVVKIGTTRYVVADPTVKAGEFMIQMVFDTAFKTKLATAAG